LEENDITLPAISQNFLALPVNHGGGVVDRRGAALIHDLDLVVARQWATILRKIRPEGQRQGVSQGVIITFLVPLTNSVR